MSTFTTPVPTATNWTLLFKFAKTTIVLPVEPTEDFSAIKQQLFNALTSTPGLEQIAGKPLPASAAEIELAIPKKAGDVYSGWKGIEPTDDDGGKNTPAGAGLKDSGILAFRFGAAGADDEWVVRIPSYDDEGVGGEDGDVVPGLEDTLVASEGSR